MRAIAGMLLAFAVLEFFLLRGVLARLKRRAPLPLALAAAAPGALFPVTLMADVDLSSRGSEL